MTEMQSEPLRVIPLDYAAPGSRRPHRFWWLAARWSLGLSLLCLLVGWVLMFFDVETVIVTGPILMLLGFMLALSALRLRLVLVMLLGIAHCTICVLFFMLVNLFSWSPREAEIPFRVMTGIYTLCMALPASGIALLYMHLKGSSRFSSSPAEAPAATFRGNAAQP